MLGWHIAVYRQKGNGRAPATELTHEAVRLAVWQTGLGGLDWIEDLVKVGKAIDLGGNGYPSRYTAPAEHLIPFIVGGPPEARKTWLFEPSDILTSKWEGKTVINRAAVARCRPDEWLLIEAWDES